MFCLLDTTSQVFHGARGREKPAPVVGAANAAASSLPNKALSAAEKDARIPLCAAGVVATTPDEEVRVVVDRGDAVAVAAAVFASSLLVEAEEVATTGAAPAAAPAAAAPEGGGRGVLHLKQWVLEPKTLAAHFGQGQS